MAKLIYSVIVSVDGYVTDAQGNFDWAAPDEEVHAYVNDLERPIGTYLYGRKMYEVMRYWQTAQTVPDQPPVVLDFAQIWQDADKVVYSTTLPDVDTARTGLERRFDAAAVRAMKATADRDLSIGGPHLAAVALRAGLVDECRLLIMPAIVGGGNRALPADVRFDLELLAERRFAAGTVYLRYLVRTQPPGRA